jgi:hypothetical protein
MPRESQLPAVANSRNDRTEIESETMANVARRVRPLRALIARLALSPSFADMRSRVVASTLFREGFFASALMNDGKKTKNQMAAIIAIVRPPEVMFILQRYICSPELLIFGWACLIERINSFSNFARQIAFQKTVAYLVTSQSKNMVVAPIVIDVDKRKLGPFVAETQFPHDLKRG